MKRYVVLLVLLAMVILAITYLPDFSHLLKEFGKIGEESAKFCWAAITLVVKFLWLLVKSLAALLLLGVLGLILPSVAGGIVGYLAEREDLIVRLIIALMGTAAIGVLWPYLIMEISRVGVLSWVAGAIFEPAPYVYKTPPASWGICASVMFLFGILASEKTKG